MGAFPFFSCCRNYVIEEDFCFDAPLQNAGQDSQVLQAVSSRKRRNTSEAQSAIIEQCVGRMNNNLPQTAEAVNSQKSAHQGLTLSLPHCLSRKITHAMAQSARQEEFILRGRK